MVSPQLPLALRLKTTASFATFVAAGHRELPEKVQALSEGVRHDSMLLWGARGSGKTHLLESAVRAALLRGRTARYLPLAQADALSPALLEDLEQDCALLCIDDIDQIAGDAPWESALFRLYLRSESCPWLCGARRPPGAAGFLMPELTSRLASGLVYQTQPLNDEGKTELIHRRAEQLGLQLDPAVASHLLERYPRDLHALMALLDRIDTESLRSQRRPTLTFVRSLAL